MSPTLLLIEALRAGKPLEAAAGVAGMSVCMAAAVAGSPLAKALSNAENTAK